MSKIESYIKLCVKEGYDTEKIKEQCIKQGYKQDLIDSLITRYTAPKKTFFFRKPRIVIGEIEQAPPKIDNDKDTYPIIEETESKGLKSQLEDINRNLSMLTPRFKEKEQKEFALPSKFKRQLKKLALKNKIMVFLMTRNRSIVPKVCEIKDGFININGTPHDCPLDSVFLWKGKYPAIVLPEWDLIPFGVENYHEAVKEHRLADPASIVIRMIQSSQNPLKGRLDPKMWIIIGLVIIALLYILFGGGV